MSAVQQLNPEATIVRQQNALLMNIGAARGLQSVLKTNLGPKGTMKMLVSGSGDVKLTKDGNVLLHEMQIQHPTASLIARAATAQDDITGDGTTSNVILVAEILKEAQRWVGEGLHPRAIAEGLTVARPQLHAALEECKQEVDTHDKELLNSVCRTSLLTKLRPDLAEKLSQLVVDAVLTIRRGDEPVDLFMVEMMLMQHKTDLDTRLVAGLVLDHGCRHPGMPKRAENAYILTCNVSLEYEKSEVNSVHKYKSAEDRVMLADSERSRVTALCQQIIDLKEKLCTDGQGFVVINQKGIDPLSLDMLARAGIMGLRRAKRRNMERLTLACGGTAVNSLEGLSEADLGRAGLVYEHVLGENKFTFVEKVENPFSCTLLVKGPNKHTLHQIKDAIRDGLRAVKNVIEDKALVPGAGAFEIYAHEKLRQFAETVTGKKKLGVVSIADALLVVPKTLAVNSGFDPLDTILTLQEAARGGNLVGLDLDTGKAMDPVAEGVWDNYAVKKQLIDSCTDIATQLLLVDEIIKSAGRSRGGGAAGMPGGMPGMPGM